MVRLSSFFGRHAVFTLGLATAMLAMPPPAAGEELGWLELRWTNPVPDIPLTVTIGETPITILAECTNPVCGGGSSGGCTRPECTGLELRWTNPVPDMPLVLQVTLPNSVLPRP